MFIYVTYGENLEELFNINVTNNILLDYVKTYTRTKMLEQINEKKFTADSMLGDLERDLERKQKIQGEVENPDDESEDIQQTKAAISAWKSFLNEEIKPYLDILNSKDLVVDFQGDANLNLSECPTAYAKDSGLQSKQSVKLVYKVNNDSEWQSLSYSLKSPHELEKDAGATREEDGA